MTTRSKTVNKSTFSKAAILLAAFCLFLFIAYQAGYYYGKTDEFYGESEYDLAGQSNIEK